MKNGYQQHYFPTANVSSLLSRPTCHALLSALSPPLTTTSYHPQPLEPFFPTVVAPTIKQHP